MTLLAFNSRIREISDGYWLMRLNDKYIDEARKMQKEILKELVNSNTPELYIADEKDEEFDAFFTSPKACALGVLTSEGKLAAVGIGSYRKTAINTLSDVLKTSGSNFTFDKDSVGYIELVQVRKEHRGHGFQKLFFNELETFFRADEKREITRLMGIVSPKNTHSLNNFHNCGYREILEFIHRSTGFKRLIMVKELYPAP